MKIDVLTLFPEMLQSPLECSIVKRAQKEEQVQIEVYNIRDYAHDKHRLVDDRPFGGGPGMVMKCEPLVEAIEDVKAKSDVPTRVIYLTPEGKRLDQVKVRELAKLPRLTFLSGHYEGIDERVRQGWVDEELSVGDYILTNGTIAAAVVIDAVVRLLPGVLGNKESALSDSFGEEKLLEGPQYTRPENFRGFEVPEILLSGNHAAIESWRREQAVKRTKERRTDLIDEKGKVNKNETD